MNLDKKLRYLLSYLTVMPRRWLFWRMVSRGSYELRLWPQYDKDFCHWQWPNLQWWLLYHTVFRFCRWLHYEAWRPLSIWNKGGYLERVPLMAMLVKRIGATTAGYAIGGGECPHCASEEGDPVDLADDETGTTFILDKTWSVGTQEGTDHRFCGTTICPACGYRAYYEDGSL